MNAEAKLSRLEEAERGNGTTVVSNGPSRTSEVDKNRISQRLLSSERGAVHWMGTAGYV